MRRNAAVRQVVLEERALRMLRALQMLQSMSIKVSSLSPPSCAPQSIRPRPGRPQHDGPRLSLGKPQLRPPGSVQARQRGSAPHGIGWRLSVFRFRSGGSCANSSRSHCATRRQRLSCRPQSCTSCRHRRSRTAPPCAQRSRLHPQKRSNRGALICTQAHAQSRSSGASAPTLRRDLVR
jgi:hypothetical protein